MNLSTPLHKDRHQQRLNTQSLNSRIMAEAKTILLDTNFLLIPAQFKVDIFAELQRACDFSYKIAVLDATVSELEGIITSKKASARDRRAAGLGLQLIKAKGVSVIKADRKVFKSTDKAILDFAVAGARSGPVIVATQDRKLREGLAARGVRVAVLRQKKYLVLQ